MNMTRSNPLDPLPKNGPDAQGELFRRFSRDADGFSAEDAIGAAMNVIANALRQAHGTATAAARSCDMLTAHMKETVMEHYTVAGQRRPIFPFHQTIAVPLFDARPKDRR